MTHFVIQSFGRVNELRRATVTILSFYAYNSTAIENTKVWLFTDQPEWFESYLHELPVEYIRLTSEKIKSMRGKIDFLHRMKISLIEEVFNQTNHPILYADSDSFFISDAQHYIRKVTPEFSFMHVHEYKFEHLHSLSMPAAATFHEFLDLIKCKDFKLIDGSTLKVTTKHSSWNAGVMIFHPAHKKLIPDVYALTDQFFPSTGNHASEQYAFSVVLQTRTKLAPCYEIVYHYWYRIKKQIMDDFLYENLNPITSMPLEQKISVVREWTQKLPVYFDNHSLTLKDNCIQALNENKYKSGYNYAFKAIKKGAYKDTKFIRDILYHAKRQLLKK